MTQSIEQRLSEFSDFWESGNYVLHRQKVQQHDTCMIYNMKQRLFVGIEDNELYEALKIRMKLEGVPVVEELPKEKSPQVDRPMFCGHRVKGVNFSKRRNTHESNPT